MAKIDLIATITFGLEAVVAGEVQNRFTLTIVGN